MGGKLVECQNKGGGSKSPETFSSQKVILEDFQTYFMLKKLEEILVIIFIIVYDSGGKRLYLTYHRATAFSEFLDGS